ncbi:hypothetical protein TRVL_02004 [Trypanosoma vivax]|nr:hypothetical protein TRVL_02004 [Trypanosoma vivax]
MRRRLCTNSCLIPALEGAGKPHTNFLQLQGPKRKRTSYRHGAELLSNLRTLLCLCVFGFLWLCANSFVRTQTVPRLFFENCSLNVCDDSASGSSTLKLSTQYFRSVLLFPSTTRVAAWKYPPVYCVFDDSRPPCFDRCVHA